MEQRLRQQPRWLTILEHTADIGLAARAASRRQLFERAAAGMFMVMGVTMATVRRKKHMTVRVEARDMDSLLVRWLSELNSRRDAQGDIYGRFDVTTLSPTRLTARVWGETWRPAHGVEREIKAVTYHGVKVKKEGRVWEARIYFDV